MPSKAIEALETDNPLEPPEHGRKQTLLTYSDRDIKRAAFGVHGPDGPTGPPSVRAPLDGRPGPPEQLHKSTSTRNYGPTDDNSPGSTLNPDIKTEVADYSTRWPGYFDLDIGEL
jgi:hypothetical protein